MIIVFGWIKENKPVRPAPLRCYCYRCQRPSGWDLWRETEWVTFFAVKTIPFLSKNYLVCERCRDVFALGWAPYLQLSKPHMHEEIAALLEQHQLGGKNEIQRNFLRAQRSEQEGRAANGPDR